VLPDRRAERRRRLARAGPGVPGLLRPHGICPPPRPATGAGLGRLAGRTVPARRDRPAAGLYRQPVPATLTTARVPTFRKLDAVAVLTARLLPAPRFARGGHARADGTGPGAGFFRHRRLLFPAGRAHARPRQHDGHADARKTRALSRRLLLLERHAPAWAARARIGWRSATSEATRGLILVSSPIQLSRIRCWAWSDDDREWSPGA